MEFAESINKSMLGNENFSLG